MARKPKQSMDGHQNGPLAFHQCIGVTLVHEASRRRLERSKAIKVQSSTSIVKPPQKKNANLKSLHYFGRI